MDYNKALDALEFVTEAASHRTDQWRDRAKGRGVDTECFDESSEDEAAELADLLGTATVTGQLVLEVLRENPDILKLVQDKLDAKRLRHPSNPAAWPKDTSKPITVDDVKSGRVRVKKRR
jgi:hypothetical protein